MVAVQFTLTKLGDKEMVEEEGGLDCPHGNSCSGWCITQFGTQGGILLVPLVVQMLVHFLCRGFYCHLL